MTTDTSPYRVLVVHSDPVVLNRLVGKLILAGYHIDSATTVGDAIRYVAAAEPDIVLTGLMLTDANGISLCRSLKRLTQSYLPVVVVTRLTEESVKIHGLNSGVDEFITGEPCAQELLARVRLLLRFKRVHDELRSNKAELEKALRRETELRCHLDQDNERLRQLSVTDPLTGLHNRRYFQQFLESQMRLAFRHEYPVSVLYLDLDRFKEVNDRLGHEGGDEVLRQFAALIRTNVRDCDLVARMGGDELAIVLVQVDASGGAVLAERLLHTVGHHVFHIKDAEASLTVSIGSATYPDNSLANGDELVNAADRAMFLAKRQGRNRYRAYHETVAQEEPVAETAS